MFMVNIASKRGQGNVKKISKEIDLEYQPVIKGGEPEGAEGLSFADQPGIADLSKKPSRGGAVNLGQRTTTTDRTVKSAKKSEAATGRQAAAETPAQGEGLGQGAAQAGEQAMPQAMPDASAMSGGEAMGEPSPVVPDEKGAVTPEAPRTDLGQDLPKQADEAGATPPGQAGKEGEPAKPSGEEPTEPALEEGGEPAKPYTGANLGAKEAASPGLKEPLGAPKAGAAGRGAGEEVSGGGGGGLSENEQRQAANQMRQQKTAEAKKREQEEKAMKETAKDEAKKKAKKTLVKRILKSAAFKAALPYILGGIAIAVVIVSFVVIIMALMLQYGPIIKTLLRAAAIVISPVAGVTLYGLGVI